MLLLVLQVTHQGECHFHFSPENVWFGLSQVPKMKYSLHSLLISLTFFTEHFQSNHTKYTSFENITNHYPHNVVLIIKITYFGLASLYFRTR